MVTAGPFLAVLLLCSAAAQVQDPLPPQETVAQLKVPEGFRVTLFAAEPDVRQPISMAIDDRGRLWVAEAMGYPSWKPTGQDRILILEDTTGQGRFDKRTVFCEGLTYVTGIEVGFGGVFVIAPPQMLFIPDRDGDDKPDGPPEVLLDGFGIQGGHNIANGFTWGPDGWLYAGHGRTSISDVGPPGTPPEKRIHFDGGVWRYHPTRRVFEAWADGTTNPWGVAFDAHGQALISNCVNPHLFHAIQGAHFEPWRGRESSRFAYRRIGSIADHLHWVGALDRSRGGPEEQLAAGGGHAHCGCMVYLGDSFPDAYRGSVFMSNLHGHRINNDRIALRGSGFTASHGPDFLISRQDRMFMALGLQYGPDGSVFVNDWYDRGECHSRDPHRESGRIYKVTYQGTAPAHPNLGKLSNEELVGLLIHKNEWYGTHAKRLLQERKAKVAGALRKLLQEDSEETHQLRAIWALHVTGSLSPETRLWLLGSPHPYVRSWAIQLEVEDREVRPGALERFEEMARHDPSPVVRLYLASACQRLPYARTLEILRGLAGHPEDADDPNLPLMIWYAAWPMAQKDPERALQFVREAKIPLLREFMARQLAMLSPSAAPPPSPLAPSGTIAYASLAPRDWDVYLADRQTGQIVRLTQGPGLNYNAMLTNDGRRIAFVSERDGNAEIYSVSSDGSGLARLTREFAYNDHPAWSPDGRALLLSSTRETAPRAGDAWNALYLMSAEGANVQRISPPGVADYSPAWAPWGEVLACASGSGEAGKTDIYVMKPDGSERKRVVSDGGWPTFMVGGGSLYFHSRRDGSWGIWRVSLNGTGLTRMTPKELEAFTPRSASHARILALAVQRGAYRQIEVMDSVTRELIPVTRDPTDHWNPSLSSDGRMVAWHQSAPDRQLRPVEVSTTPPGTRLAMLRVEGAFPAFSPDGKRLALTSSGFGELELMGVDGQNRRKLFADPSRKVFGVSWSPRQDWIAFSAGPAFQGPSARVDLEIQGTDGSAPRPLTSGEGNNAFPAFSPDGERLVFRSGRAGAMSLYTIRKDGSDLQKLTSGAWTDTMPDWSPLGERIAFATNRSGEFEIWMVKPDGSEPRKLVGGGGRNTHPRFSRDGKWIVFASQRAGYSAEEISLPAQPQPYGDLFAVRTDGEGLIRLTHSPFEEGTPAWGPAVPEGGAAAGARKGGD